MLLVLLILALALAAAIFLAFRARLPLRARIAVPAETAPSVLADITQLVEKMPIDGTRLRVRNTIDVSEKLLRYAEAHPEKASDSLFVVRQYLEALRTGIKRYLEILSYAPDSAPQARANLAELLETVYHSLTHLHSELVEKETSDLARELHVLNQTLQEIDQVWLRPGEGRGSGTE